ncbi:hypothetical protein PHLCEN_2v1504 [Hermanssonia centrifuga]|uniref:non-specific serine/threonine protein kinase n=1 Tax=Hermanssonia centrifuga TaxID=98765 RepID=A0A2R6RZS9_9APHY|nr:hypothetical protein PHLCEN_2v1504 [Hermanssonia centrifuga]
MAELMRVQLMCLQEIHFKCVIHADIKPSNIFLHVQNGSYQVYLIDFGYALIVNERRVSSQNEPPPGSAAAIRGGTILFSSINWQHDRPISYRDDLESLVYTLLYLRFGQLPWWNPRSGHIVLDEDVVEKLKQTWVDLPWAPTELVDLWHYARELRVDEKPDYDYILGTIFRDDKHA